jgi:hypothetical protein
LAIVRFFNRLTKIIDIRVCCMLSYKKSDFY